MTMSAEELANACKRIANLARASSTGCTAVLASDDVSALEEAARVLSAIAGVRSETADKLESMADNSIDCGERVIELLRRAAAQLRACETERAETDVEIKSLGHLCAQWESLAKARASLIATSRAEALSMDQPWSVPSIVKRLCDAAEHLLRVHDCDAHGHEGVKAALDAGREWLAARSSPAPAEGTSTSPEDIRLMHAHLTSSPTPTCKRCGKPRLDWQVFCGAACSAQWDAGDRKPSTPSPVPETKSPWNAIRHVVKADGSRSPSVYARHGYEGTSEVYLDVHGRWNAWAMPAQASFATAEEAMAAVDALRLAPTAGPPRSVVEAIWRWGEAEIAIDDAHAIQDQVLYGRARLAAEGPTHAVREAVIRWVRGLRSRGGTP